MRLIECVDFNSITSLLAENPLIPSLYFSITDLDGNTIASTRWQKVCSCFHRFNPETHKKCLQSDKVLANQIKKGHEYALYSCLNNLTNAATPIRVEDECIGNLIIGQVFIKAPDLDYFEKQAEKYGFDKQEYLAAIREVPVVEEEELRKLISFYAKLTSMFGLIAKEASLFKNLNEKLSMRTAELEYVNGELEAFSYSVSHDLRAPLRHITGFIDLFNRKCKDDLSEQGIHYLDAIYNSAIQMGVLIDDLLNFSRNGRAVICSSSISMDTIVSDIIQNYTDSHPERSVSWHVSQLPEAYADEIMFKFVWYNLIDNALKFTGRNDRTVIEIGYLPKQKAYFIKDNGVGFDMRYAGKLFGVFQRLHPSTEFEGTGIGLASVKRIISRHEGRIWAEAEPDRGAVFYFTIPGKDGRDD